MKLVTNIAILLALLLGPYLYQRLSLILALKDNAPGRIQPFSSFTSHRVGFSDQLRNCEDIILLDGLDGTALLSCDEARDRWNTVMGIFKGPEHQGKLFLYDYASPSAQPQPLKLLDFPASESDFHPLGIEYHSASKTLFVINHAQAGSRLELFRLWPRDQAATHLQTIIHPQIHSPNSLAVIDEHSFYLTNDHYFLSRFYPWLAKLETWLASPLGNVLHFHIPSSKATVLARIPFANGVVLLNDTAIAVASTTTTSVHIYSTNPQAQTPELTLKTKIPIPFLPDNLSIDSAGKLLIAGHPHPFSMIQYAKTRDACRTGSGKERELACEVRASTGVAEWTEAGGVRMLWMGEEFATGSTAVRDVQRGVGIVSGLYERGLLVWKE
ncbi:hypothetical protein Q7P37_008401 [Cladosporium fusiforme]